jgi:FAD/FMN-containing dehydrogenase
MTLDFAARSAATTTATAPNLARSLHELGQDLQGQLVLPGSDDYEAGRQVHNLAFQRHPIAIVRPASTADVALAVQFARTNRLPLAVRSGGHSVAGHSTTDGVVIDMSRMKDLDIDPVGRTARAEAGLRAGEVTTEAGKHGLAVPFGDTGSVGIGGITLGGGIGFLVRKYGLTIDSLLSVEMVTAAGEAVTASATENPDLFWALRGGGGNFGIVTAFTYRLSPVGMIYGGMLALPATPDVLRRYGAAAAAAPDDLSMVSFVMHLPPMPFLPPELYGRLSLVAFVTWSGDPADGPAALEPIRALATPLADLLGPMPYSAMYKLTEQGEMPAASSMRAAFLPSLEDGVADAIIDHMTAATSPFSFAQIRVLGGEMARVPADATAFAHRNAKILLAIMAQFEGSDPAAQQAWTEGFYEAIRPHADGVYVNFLEDEGPARIHEAYPDGTFARLAAVKATWDPQNVFALNQNIAPTAAPTTTPTAA